MLASHYPRTTPSRLPRLPRRSRRRGRVVDRTKAPCDFSTRYSGSCFRQGWSIGRIPAPSDLGPYRRGLGSASMHDLETTTAPGTLMIVSPLGRAVVPARTVRGRNDEAEGKEPRRAPAVSEAVVRPVFLTMRRPTEMRTSDFCLTGHLVLSTTNALRCHGMFMDLLQHSSALIR